jgi:hypothetical protein
MRDTAASRSYAECPFLLCGQHMPALQALQKRAMSISIQREIAVTTGARLE